MTTNQLATLSDRPLTYNPQTSFLATLRHPVQQLEVIGFVQHVFKDIHPLSSLNTRRFVMVLRAISGSVLATCILTLVIQSSAVAQNCYKLNVKSTSYGFTQIWPDAVMGSNSYYTLEAARRVIANPGEGWQVIGWANYCAGQCGGTFPGCNSQPTPPPPPKPVPQPDPPAPPKPAPPSVPCTRWYWELNLNGRRIVRGPFTTDFKATQDMANVIRNNRGARIAKYPYCSR